MKKIISLFVIIFLLCGCGKKVDENLYENEEESSNIPTKEKIDIIDVNSNTRPFAVVVNNATVAVKVQQGLQKAYMVYEIPVEGNMTRLLAFYKDIDDLKVGTIRSARHNFLDYVFEQDAIFVHWGWSHYAKDQIRSLNVESLNGLYDSAFWRENPLNLAIEHTGYTSIQKVRDLSKEKGFSLTSDKGLVLNYSLQEVNLNDSGEVANKIYIPSSNVSNTSYEYDSDKKLYLRSVNGNKHIDYLTKEQYTAKNIIIQKINTRMASDNYYWELETVGSGEGMYITNGYATPIKWSKENRKSKTIYTYPNGEEVKLNDGNTYIQLQSNNQKYTIE